jgi:Protein of unknown function (DUF2510)
MTAPGWYPDPSGIPGQRYWDGIAWTDARTTPPGWQPPATDGRGEAKCPGTVIGAAVIAFILAAVALVGAFSALVMALTGNDDETQIQVWGSNDVGPVLLWSLVRLVMCGLLVWGGFAALRGKTNKVLTFTFLGICVYSLSLIVVSVMAGSPPRILAYVGLILQCVALWLIRVRQSKEFFSARGGTAV